MSSGPHVASLLGSWAAGLGALERPVADDARRRILDSVGIMLAASAMSAEGAAVRTVAPSLGGTGRSTVIGDSTTLSPAGAALANGTLAHALDFDDTHLPSVLHPSASVIPGTLAVFEDLESGDEEALLASIAVGIEVTNRLGMGSYDPNLGNSVLFEYGFHATSICGAVGVAASTAKLTGMPAEGIAHAMAIAASMGSGIIEANRTGGTVKKTHCGWAAHAGIAAMLLARAGITGAPTAFEGRFGFFQAFAKGYFDRESVVGDLGDRWEMLRTHFKPYPSNHFTHGAVDAALDLRSRGLVPERIERVTLGVAAPTLRTIAEPAEVKAVPPTPYAAQFSGPFVLARALLGGGGLGIHLDDFTEETITDPATLALAAKVTCHADDEATRLFPNAFPASVVVTDDGGTEWRSWVEANRGGPDRPLATDELDQKFRLNASRAVPGDVAARIADLVLSLGQGSSGELFSTLRTGHA